MERQQRIAVVPGSFDPITKGHMDIIRRAKPLFDMVSVLVVINAVKNPGFSLQERGELIRAAVADTWDAHPGAQAVLITVNAANVASWRAVEKAGLTFLTEGDMPPDNPIDDPLHRIRRIDRPAHNSPG